MNKATHKSVWRILLPLELLAIGSVQPAASQDFDGPNGRYRYRVALADTPPMVDGDLSDPAWEKADIIDQFIQQEPDSGAPSTEKTQVRMVYDSGALFISAYCFDS